MRYEVQMGTETVCVKIDNLSEAKINEFIHSKPPELALGAHVEVSGLQKASDLNGMTGVVMFYDNEAERYEVNIDGGLKKIRRENLIPRAPPAAIPIHSKVQLHGLQAAALNGLMGRV